MTDEKILENYANEYCDVLNAYDVNSKYFFEMKPEYFFQMKAEVAFVFKDFFSFAMLKIENVENQKYILSMTNSGYLFKDNAPFNEKKEVSCDN